MVTPHFVSALRPVLAALLVSAGVIACSDPEPILLQPLAPGVLPTHRTSEGRPPPGVRPLMTRARWIVADGAHRGIVGSRESARLIAGIEPSTEPSVQAEDEPRAERAAPTPTQQVDLNSASVAELDTLPGVGPAIAERIVDGRPYGTLDDLKRVPGIGPATLERIRPRAVVQPPGR